MELNSFENMPREDLIIELQAWRGKFENEVKKEVDKKYSELQAKIDTYEEDIKKDAAKAYSDAGYLLDSQCETFGAMFLNSMHRSRINELKEATKTIKSILGE